MEFGILLRLVGMMNLILILSHPFSIQKIELYFTIGLHLDIYRPVYFKLCMMTETTKLDNHILILVWMTLNFVQSHSCLRN